MAIALLAGCTSLPSERALLERFETQRESFEELVAVLDGLALKPRERDERNRYKQDPDYQRLAAQLGVLELSIAPAKNSEGNNYFFRVSDVQTGLTMIMVDRGFAYYVEPPSPPFHFIVPSLDKFGPRHLSTTYYVFQPIDHNWYLYERNVQ
jgi:hypothetical protein